MKVVGILLIGLVSAILAAAVSYVSGGTIWMAVLNYLGVGMIATLLGAAVLIWRTSEADRPAREVALGGAASVGK